MIARDPRAPKRPWDDGLASVSAGERADRVARFVPVRHFEPLEVSVARDRGIGQADLARMRDRLCQSLCDLGTSPDDAALGVRDARRRDLDHEDVVPRIDDGQVGCTCGEVVFRHPRAMPLVYVCVRCSRAWRGTC